MFQQKELTMEKSTFRRSSSKSNLQKNTQVEISEFFVCFKQMKLGRKRTANKNANVAA